MPTSSQSLCIELKLTLLPHCVVYIQLHQDVVQDKQVIDKWKFSRVEPLVDQYHQPRTNLDEASFWGYERLMRSRRAMSQEQRGESFPAYHWPWSFKSWPQHSCRKQYSVECIPSRTAMPSPILDSVTFSFHSKDTSAHGDYFGLGFLLCARLGYIE